jgi:hypothetical protein
VDTAALRAAAQRFDTAADLLDAALRAQLSRLRFDGALAGRAHVAGGDAVRAALDRLAAEVAQWSRAAAEVAAALRATADGYADAELNAAIR